VQGELEDRPLRTAHLAPPHDVQDVDRRVGHAGSGRMGAL
jgi:hypothetical protein